MENTSGRAVTSAFTPTGRALGSGSSTGALAVTCARTYACAPVTLSEAIGAPAGPVVGMAAVWLGEIAGVEAAGATPAPVGPHPASVKVTATSRARMRPR